MPKDTNSNDSPELLNALESIKGLLEKSESKLSAARESLKKAKPQNNQQGIVRPSVSSEPVVPVLDDVVTSLAEELDEQELPLLDDDVPVLESVLEPEPAVLETELDSQATGYSEDEILAYIDGLQQKLEKELRNTLMRTVVNIEAEIKKTLAEQIQKLKDEIGQTRQD
jgi:Asp-tRNA(Asn)/Glu-tRNA(Gln) amidotransferase A subunit family amidase